VAESTSQSRLLSHLKYRKQNRERTWGQYILFNMLRRGGSRHQVMLALTEHDEDFVPSSDDNGESLRNFKSEIVSLHAEYFKNYSDKE
jgi:hypothetical protein